MNVRDLWGESNRNSSAITAESARLLGIPGYIAPFSSDSVRRAARLLLEDVSLAQPSRRTLYSGHSRPFNVPVGAELDLPLTALSDNKEFALTFTRSGVGTLLVFPRYAFNAASYSDVEWITAGRFSVVRAKTTRDPFWQTPLRMLTLRQVGRVEL